jgi:hypothetical protein
VDDDDRALRVMDTLLADRAEQKAGEASMPTRSDDEEVVRGRCLDEHFRSGPLDHLVFDFDACALDSEVGDCPFEQVLRSSVELGQVDPE